MPITEVLPARPVRLVEGHSPSPSWADPACLPSGPRISESADTRPGDPEAAHAPVPQGGSAGGTLLPVGTEAAQPEPP